MLVSVRCPPSVSWQCCPTPTGCWCVSMLLLCDVSKREVSTQPKLTVLPHAYLNADVGVDCSAFLSRGMVVLLVMTGCRLFHMLMVLGKKDV